MILSTLDILYIVLTIVIAVTGTLFALLLIKLNRIVWVFEEISSYYYTIKATFQMYEHLPKAVLDKISQVVTQVKEKTTRKKSS